MQIRAAIDMNMPGTAPTSGAELGRSVPALFAGSRP